jgi:hypothetical protein
VWFTSTGGAPTSSPSGVATRRPLRIYVDGEAVPDSPELEVLMGFANHPEIEVIWTDDSIGRRAVVPPGQVE